MHPSRPGSPMTPASMAADTWPLTPRETEVLAAMAAGKTNAAIADVLFISRKAVEKHVNAIFSKLLVPGREEYHPRVQAALIYLGHQEARNFPAPRLSGPVRPAWRCSFSRRRHCGSISPTGR
jgi:DNA-binding NarL/FixJ family response regulator